MASKKVWVKVHHSKTGEVVVAACDEDLLGKKIKVNDSFSVEVSKAFYGGFLVKCDEFDKYLEQAGIVNLLGESIISYLIRKGLVSEKAVIRLGEIPHVQLFLRF
ncbi:MAG: DUF424 domain-containing protein [Thaumarchaeota archaeon]|nr:MAG: DUF424 domain-containing protein [Nitrososphaerota archaeon]